MTKQITWIFILVFGITLAFNCKKKDTTAATTYTNANYAGAWTVNEHCPAAASYVMTITATGSNGVTLTNFKNGFTVTGTVSNTALTIPLQSVTSTTLGGPYKFSGSGTLNSASSLSISYSMTDNSGGNAINCTDTDTK